MRIRQLPLLGMALTALLSASVSAKVTIANIQVDEQYVSDQNASLAKTLEPMHPNESTSSTATNQMGTWVKVSSAYTYINSAGSYSMILSTSSVGQSCVKGTKGLLVNVSDKAFCDSGGRRGENKTCRQIGEYLDTGGYKAECL